MSRPNRAWLVCVLWLVGGCDQLGNPQQFATGPTTWNDKHGRVVTTTRSFRNEKTIRRLLSEGLADLDHADPSIGPSQTLTLVSVVLLRLRRPRRGEVQLITMFELSGQAPVVRRWSAPASSRRWHAAFALPEPPISAVTSVAP